MTAYEPLDVAVLEPLVTACEPLEMAACEPFVMMVAMMRRITALVAIIEAVAVARPAAARPQRTRAIGAAVTHNAVAVTTVTIADTAVVIVM